MTAGMKKFGIVAGVLASTLCMAAGIWILVNSGFDPDDPIFAGIGLYFIGKAVFVGPMLILSSLQGRGS